ncbi:P-selectin glycoprotein ligand 1 [Parambassis ranga]|uniref:P-selectin glycoprotein ligand 1 n=1 Tax=Parambassis ranga TaxID=210632 RepID=A0A6P7J8Y0_9TELE|nr:P-selectin glycoprotein ligand 1 [Parambassis ranga]XP_028273210.1 P-selectin glycoprotein ligand 1 [Parambassis ranga]
MMLLSVKTYAALLWVLLAVESMNVSTPETSSSHVTNKQPTSAKSAPHNDKESQVTTWHPDTYDDVTESIEITVETNSTVLSSPSAAATRSSGMLHASTAVTTAAEGGAHSHSTNITKTVKPTEERSADAVTDTTASATTSAALSTTVASSSPPSTSFTNPEITSVLSTNTSSDRSENLTSPPASPTTTQNPTSASTPGFIHTSLPTVSETSTELRSATQSISTATTLISTSQPADTTSSSSTSISTDPPNSTVANYTSTAGVLIPREPKTSPPATTTSPPSTTEKDCDLPKGPSTSEVQPCSTRGVVKPCLIAIAALAGLATIFMVSTIVLCTKLSARKHKVKKPQQATEMMCISALLPDTTSTRQRSYIPNGGVLVFPGGADSDEDGGDNLTLSSFLPENDRYV